LILSETSVGVFQCNLDRLRRGDQDAIGQFVAQYEPFIRRTLRYRIARAALQSAADSIDVCQSVLGGFLLRLAAGEYELHTEEDLRKLLMAIANKKFLVLNRRETAAKRDRRQTRSLEDVDDIPESAKKTTIVDHLELLQEVSKRLKPEEQQLFHWRREGQSWETISDRMSQDALILRKRLSRALHRVAIELKLEDEGDG